MDITKYLKNKDVKITNEDFDIDAMRGDFNKGLVDPKEATKDMINKSEYTELTNKYADLETKYQGTIETLNSTNSKVAKVTLEKEMIGAGFKEENFEEISKLRTSLYAEEKDDKTAISSIKEKYKATYFPEAKTQTPTVPNEGGLSQNQVNSNPQNEIKITRTSRLSQFIQKK